jgi:hypothetical protein
MNRPELPLKIISLLSPIISRAEGAGGTLLPGAQDDASTATSRIICHSSGKPTEISQQHDWLLQQLLTYSRDNIDDMMSLSKRTDNRQNELPC